MTKSSENRSTTPSIKIENPWNINSIYDLQYYNCPGCLYKNHSKQDFIDHTYEIHPEIIENLNKIGDGSLDDINCPWKINEFSIKQENFENNTDYIIEDPLENFDNSELKKELNLNSINIRYEDNVSTTKYIENENLHTCDLCCKKFQYARELKEHVSIIHHGQWFLNFLK